MVAVAVGVPESPMAGVGAGVPAPPLDVGVVPSYSPGGPASGAPPSGSYSYRRRRTATWVPRSVVSHRRSRIPVHTGWPAGLGGVLHAVDRLEDDLVRAVALAGLALTSESAAKQWADQQCPFEFGGIHLFSQFSGFWNDLDETARYIFTMNSVTPQTETT